MPLFDRFWWLRLVMAALAAAFGALVLARLVVPVVGVVPISGDTWLALALGVAPLLIAAALWVSTSPARDRSRRRARALAGDADAMLSVAVPHSESGAWVSRVRRPLPRPPRRLPWPPLEQLAIYWRAGWLERVYAGFLTFIALGCLIISIAVLITFVRFLLTGEPQRVLRLSLSAIALLILFLAIALYLLYWSIPALLGRRPGVEVTRDGIITRQLWGRARTVRWDEARLLEISAPHRLGLMKPHRTFRLYGARSVAVWRDELRPLADYRLELFEPDRPYRYQVRERMNALLDHVMKRTGLAPCTFSRQLAAREADTAADQGPAPIRDAAANQPGESHAQEGER